MKAVANVDRGTITIEDIEFELVDKESPNVRGYVLSTWVRSAWDVYRKVYLVLDGKSYRLSNAEFLQFYPDYAENMLDNHTVWCVQRPNHEGVYYGYIVCDGNNVLWSYVPPELRRKGLFTALCEVTKCKTKTTKVNLTCPWPFRTTPSWLKENHPFMRPLSRPQNGS